MNTPKNPDTLTEKLQLLESIQTLIDERLNSLAMPEPIDPIKSTVVEYYEHRKAEERYYGEREGLNQAWLLIQHAAVKLKYPGQQVAAPTEKP